MTTTISSSSFAMQRPSPRDMLQATLSSQVAAGKINSADKDALSAALDSIDSAMRSDRASGSRQAPPSPEEARAKIDSLISNQVEAGSLTSEQAEELKQLFADTFAGGLGGPGGGRPPGPPPGPPPGEGDGQEAISLTITTTDSDVSKALQAFLKQLTEKLGSGYGQSGQGTAASSTSLLFNITA